LHYALEKLRESQHGVNLSELWGDTGVWNPKAEIRRPNEGRIPNTEERKQ
jgi:hypothetical protein